MHPTQTIYTLFSRYIRRYSNTKVYRSFKVIRLPVFIENKQKGVIIALKQDLMSPSASALYDTSTMYRNHTSFDKFGTK